MQCESCGSEETVEWRTGQYECVECGYEWDEDDGEHQEEDE